LRRGRRWRAQNGRGYWVAKDKAGLVGGVFRTQKDALRLLCLKWRATAPAFELFHRMVLCSTETNGWCIKAAGAALIWGLTPRNDL